MPPLAPAWPRRAVRFRDKVLGCVIDSLSGGTPLLKIEIFMDTQMELQNNQKAVFIVN